MIVVEESSGYTSLHQDQPVVELVGGEQLTSQRSLKEIREYILSKNNGHCFDSAMRFKSNFDTHIRRLAEAQQIALYKQDGKIVGAVGWIWTDDTYTLGKGYWYTPKDITQGKILYVSFAALDEGVRLSDWIKLLRKQTTTRGTEEVHWGHYKRNVFKKRRIN